MGEFAKAYEKYKSSLKLIPGDKKAKYNLEYVLMVMDDNKKLKRKKKDGKQRNTRKKSGSLTRDNSAVNDPKDKRRNSEMKKDDFNGGINFNDNLNIQTKLDDISKDDAWRILNTLNQKVMMRRPMREEPLTKRGEYDEKDW